MQQYGRSAFADLFASMAADSDYTHFADLRDFTQYDIRAAAEALWGYAMFNNLNLDRVGVTEEAIVSALRARTDFWNDEGELVSLMFEEFWDAVDDQKGLSPGLREQIKMQLASHFLAEKRATSIVVNNRDGIWLFDKAAIWSDDK